MTMEFVPGQTRIWVSSAGGEPIELSGSTIGPIQFERVTEENFLDGWNRPIRITFRQPAERLSPLAYRLLVGFQHPRIRRMHMAYGRKRGRGRR